MAEAFVRTFKRDYAGVSPRPDAVTVLRQLPAWFEHYNEVHPHRALGYRSPRQFIRASLLVRRRQMIHLIGRCRRQPLACPG